MPIRKKKLKDLKNSQKNWKKPKEEKFKSTGLEKGCKAYFSRQHFRTSFMILAARPFHLLTFFSRSSSNIKTPKNFIPWYLILFFLQWFAASRIIHTCQTHLL